MSSSWVAVQSAPSPRCCCDPWACAALSSKGTQTLASATPRILHTILRLNLTMQRYPRAVALDADAARLFSLVSPDLCAWLQRHVLPCHIDIRNGSPCGKPPLAPSSSPSLQAICCSSTPHTPRRRIIIHHPRPRSRCHRRRHRMSVTQCHSSISPRLNPKCALFLIPHPKRRRAAAAVTMPTASRMSWTRAALAHHALA